MTTENSLHGSLNSNPNPAGLKALIAFVCIFALTLALFYDTAASMVDIWWRSETFAHGFIIAPITLWLIWRKRDELVRITPQPCYLALPLLFANGLVWFFADLVDINVVKQAAFVAFILLTVLALWGWPLVKAIFFPLAFLLFSVPAGEGLIPPMMEFTADFTVAMVELTGIPVYREGMFFELPSGNWSVVEGCSGVRYLIASITLGTLYAYLTYSSYTKRTIFIVMSIIVPIFANGFRAYMIVMIAHYSDMKLALGVDHFIYGWVWFGMVIFTMFFIGSFWRDDVDSVDAGNSSSALHLFDSKKFYTSAASVAVLLLVWPGMAWVQANTFADNLSVNMQAPNSELWNKTDSAFTTWKPRYQSPAAEFTQFYTANDEQVGLYIALYTNQKQDQELINSQNFMIEQKHPVWAEKGQGKTALSISNAGQMVNESVLRSPAQSLYINHWYWIDGVNSTNEIFSKLTDAKMRLFSDKPVAAGIVVFAELGEEKAIAQATIQKFVSDMMPAIEKSLSTAVTN